MSRGGRNSRRESKRSIKLSKANKAKQAIAESKEEAMQFKEGKNRVINKRYLILCEGETEEVYFSGLKNNILLKAAFAATEIVIIAPTHKKNVDYQDNIRDNSLRGLTWEAMKRKRLADKEKNPFDEIWIVIDNDERNSYVISKGVIDWAKDHLTVEQHALFSTFDDAFFLSDRHYLAFLQCEIGLDAKMASSILSNTVKNTMYEDYENPDPSAMFFAKGKFVYGESNKKEKPNKKDYDPTWKTWLKKAYSCRTFENWLLLHFEQNRTPFIISKEDNGKPKMPENVFHRIWEFVKGYSKGIDSKKSGKIDAYNLLKPQPFNKKYETQKEAQAVIDKMNKAILNSHWLRNEMEPELVLQGGAYYEVNPYTDVDYLLCSLFEKEVFYGSLKSPFVFDEIEIACEIMRNPTGFKVDLMNHSRDKRVLINRNNMANFFKILTIDQNGNHAFLSPQSLSETINIPPCDTKIHSFSIGFARWQEENDTYLVVQNRDVDKYLYMPI